MRLSAKLSLLLTAAVGAGRLVELRVSRRRLRALADRGVARVDDPAFPWIVAVHAGMLAGSALEANFLKRRGNRALAVPAGIVLVTANMLRWWTIASMSEQWNVHVMDSASLGIVTAGPFRWIRHPNYLAVLVELEALALLRAAWLTALLGGAAHALVLRRRIATEEAVLMQYPDYRREMAWKPRFIPRLRAGGGLRAGG